jgi:hypothetical protein
LITFPSGAQKAAAGVGNLGIVTGGAALVKRNERGCLLFFY